LRLAVLRAPVATSDVAVFAIRALYEGPYDVLRYALRALGDEAGAKRAELEYHAATAVRVARS